MSEKQSENGGDHEGQEEEEEETVEAKSGTQSSAHPEQSNVEAESAPPPPEISRSHKPLEGLTTRKSLNRSVFSKPKSRFGEQPAPIDSSVLEETSLEQVGADFTSFKEGSSMRILMESSEKALEGILEMQPAKGVEVGKEETVEAKGPLLKGSESSAPEQSNLNLPMSAESLRVGSPPPEIHISSRRNSLTRSSSLQTQVEIW
ncbi:hypothetical protein M0R45_009216 [Rubus argutus]|uniref:Uncharacterized protein n=1 Tax=Rubus argutus TaxID=59490 RepID=A0AAW1Y3A9_RUBAR